MFTHGHKKYISFDLGLEDTFIVPDILTQKSTVYMQPEFQRNDDVVHGSIVWFRLEKSMPAAITPPVEPAPDYILIAVDPYALVSGDYDMWIESPTPKELSAGEYELTLQGVI